MTSRSAAVSYQLCGFRRLLDGNRNDLSDDALSAARLGISPFVTGLIFGVPGLAAVTAGILAGRLLGTFGFSRILPVAMLLQGLATGLTTMTQQVAISVGIPILSAIAASQAVELTGIHLALSIDVAVTLVSASLVWIGLRARSAS